ncbi:MAG TPA: FAD-dependent oxidoreductase [Gemmatimonadaceae bacterium]|nr:FAD-dependent oxidoreductase [Gemmatimonadaceae bacterium]
MKPDVLVVGGGPAGASVAFQLARRGVRVTVLERARFPRAKPCAECLSPRASEILEDMGVLAGLASRGAWLKGMVVRSPSGITAKGDYAAHHGFRSHADGGLALRREILDSALLDRARDAGARVTEDARVVEVVRDAYGRVRGVTVRSPTGRVHELDAPLVMAADGLRSVIAKRLGLARTRAWPDRISVVAHYHGVSDISQYGEMHVEGDGFVGIADVGDGMTTVAAVFPRGNAKAMAGDPAAYLHQWLLGKPQLAGRFTAALRDGSASAIGPFASHARRAWHPGALLVGDAADFFDPFTGEGIYAALRGGQLAADAAFLALETPHAEESAFREYGRRRRLAFRGKWMVEQIIGACVGSPAVVNRAARALAARKELADLLVGVTGDFVPASEVLRLGYLARLFVLPVPATTSRSYAHRLR